jgi:hypothetical protein
LRGFLAMKSPSTLEGREISSGPCTHSGQPSSRGYSLSA